MGQPSALEVTLEYPDLSAFVAGFEMVTREGIELPSPFSRSPGETVRFVVRTLDRAIVLEGTGVVADVVDNGRLYRPDERYDLAIAFSSLSATSEVVIERILVAREFATSDPTGMRKIPPEVRDGRATAKASPRTASPPSLPTRPPAPVIREVTSSSDLLEEVDEEDFLTPPPRPLPGPPSKGPLAPPPVPRKALTVPPPTRPHGTTPRSSSAPPEAPASPRSSSTGTPPARASTAPEPARASSVMPGRASSAPPARPSSAPPPLPSRRPAAPPTAEAPPPPTDTFDDGVPIDTVTVTVARKPPMDTQTEVRPAAAATPRPPPKGSPPAPTKAAPVPRTIGQSARPAAQAAAPTTAPPRRKTGTRPAPASAIDAAPPPQAEPPRAPPRRKTLPGATGTDPGPSPAKPRRRTGAARPAIPEPGPDAPPLRRRRTGQRAAIPMPEDSPTSRIDAPADDETGRFPTPPRRR